MANTPNIMVIHLQVSRLNSAKVPSKSKRENIFCHYSQVNPIGMIGMLRDQKANIMNKRQHSDDPLIIQHFIQIKAIARLKQYIFANDIRVGFRVHFIGKGSHFCLGDPGGILKGWTKNIQGFQLNRSNCFSLKMLQ